MLTATIRATLSKQTMCNVKRISTACYPKALSSSFYDPPYLDALKPKIPVYDVLNVQMHGYDFAILENYQRVVHKIAKMMDIEVEDAWATPATQTKVQKYKPNSTVIDSEYILTTYERNVQVVEVASTTAAVFLEAVEAALPGGVRLSVHGHEEHHDKLRYVPDMELKQLKNQLDSLGGPVTTKKK